MNTRRQRDLHTQGTRRRQGSLARSSARHAWAGSWGWAGALAVLLATSCDKSEPAASSPPTKDEVAEKASQAARAIKDYAFAQRDELVQRTSSELATLRIALDDLNAKVERQGTAASAESKAKLVAVRERWEKVQAQLELARSASAKNWDELKDALSTSFDELDRAFHDARQ